MKKQKRQNNLTPDEIQTLLNGMAQVQRANWHLDHTDLFEALVVHKQYDFGRGPDDDWDTIHALHLGGIILVYGATREAREREARQRMDALAATVWQEGYVCGLSWKFYGDKAYPWQYHYKPGHPIAPPQAPQQAAGDTHLALQTETIRRAVLVISDFDDYLTIAGLAPFMKASVNENEMLVQISGNEDQGDLGAVIREAMIGGCSLPKPWQLFVDALKQAAREDYQELLVKADGV